MDPNETLRALRAAVRKYETSADANGSADDEHEAAAEMAEAISALDEWITRGGFLPDSWKPCSYDSNPAR